MNHRLTVRGLVDLMLTHQMESNDSENKQAASLGILWEKA